jgi:hypothetical protein
MFNQKGVERSTMVHGKKIEGQGIAIYFETWEKNIVSYYMFNFVE